MVPTAQKMILNEKPNMKQVLITGSSGYIGQHLVSLLKDQYLLTGLDNRKLDNVELHVVDINNLSRFKDVEYDTVVHLAALVNVGESVNRPIDYYQTNVTGTLNVLKTIKCQNYVFASTGAAEQPGSPYGLSKRMAEDIVRHYCERNGINYTIFRFYNVIGTAGFAPTNPDGLFYNLIKASKTGVFNLYGTDYATKDGTCVRDYVHVMEICHAIKSAIERPAKGLENLGHGQGHTVKEIVDLFKRVNGVDFAVNAMPRRAGDLEKSVLATVSPYMKNLYSMEDLLRVK
jgi:UDP-glucose 4-epimerase